MRNKTNNIDEINSNGAYDIEVNSKLHKEKNEDIMSTNINNNNGKNLEFDLTSNVQFNYQTPKYKVPVICDVDTGIDDAAAIALALADEKIDLKLITTCAGNTSIENVTLNTLTILQWLNRGDVPVAQGADKPLVRTPLITKAHGGATGMGNYPFEKCTLQKSAKTAVEAMYETAKQCGQVVIICIAPATNVAMLLQTHPDVTKFIRAIVFQSGLLSDENYPSFNVTSDPEAMQVVIDSKVPLLICPSDMGHVTSLNDQEVDIIRATNITGEMFATIFQSYRDRVCQNNVAMHDSCAVACVTQRKLFEMLPTKCSIIECPDSDKKIFRLEVNHPQHNCYCCTKIDIKNFKHYMLEMLKRCP